MGGRLKTVWLDQGWQPSAIGFVPTRKAWRDAMKRVSLDDPWPFDARSTAAHVKWIAHSSTGESIIYVAVNEKLIGDDAVHLVLSLVHEASHVVDFVFEHTGQEPCTETRAYAIEGVMRGLLNAYSQTLGKGKVFPK